MKKFLAVIAVILVIVMSFVACNKKDALVEPTPAVTVEPTPEATPEGNTEETPEEESGEQTEGSEVVSEE